MANYGRELRVKADIGRRENMEKSIEFVERMRKVQKEDWCCSNHSSLKDK